MKLLEDQNVGEDEFLQNPETKVQLILPENPSEKDHAPDPSYPIQIHFSQTYALQDFLPLQQSQFLLHVLALESLAPLSVVLDESTLPGGSRMFEMLGFIKIKIAEKRILIKMKIFL